MKKNLQIQIGISVKHVAVDLIIDNEGVLLNVDTLGDVSELHNSGKSSPYKPLE